MGLAEALVPRASRAGVARAWVARGGVSVLDHGLLSAGNLAAGLLLARWLEPDAYGAFTIAFATFIFLSALHDALLLEPTSVIGPVRYEGTLRAYFAAGLAVHARLTVPLGLVFVAAGAVTAAVYGGPLGGALIGAGIAMPALLLLLLARRFFHVLGAPGWAALGSGAYLFGVVAGLLALRTTGIATPASAFVAMGGAGLAAACVLVRAARVRDGAPAVAWRDVLAAHWSYGRWIAATALLYAGALQAPAYFAGSIAGLPAAGALRAMQIVTLPMLQVTTAIAAVTLPVLARDRTDVVLLRRRARTVTAALVACAIAYELVLLLGAAHIERLLYGGKFGEHAWLLPVLGLVPVFAAVTTGSSLVLRSLERPQYYLVVTAITVPVAVAGGLVLSAWWGIGGAAVSAVATSAAGAAGALALVRRDASRRERP